MPKFENSGVRRRAYQDSHVKGVCNIDGDYIIETVSGDVKIITEGDLAGNNKVGAVKTTSTVTSTSGLTASPIIDGVPYYKDTNTDTKVNTKLATTSKAYILGTTTTPTSTTTGVTAVADTGVYLGVSAGELVATKFTGTLNGTASSANSVNFVATNSPALTPK